MLSTTEIVNMIMRAAAGMKDPEPTAIRYVYGTRNDLSTFVSREAEDGAEGHRQAVLVEAVGNFTWIHSAPLPVKGPPRNKSTGAALFLIIDLETGQQTDWGILKQPKDLSPLGLVFTAPVPKRTK